MRRDNWEIIVVNDGGERSFAELDPALVSELPLTLHTTEHAGPANARNVGVTLACGEYIVFTDDDCRITSGWLDAFAEGFDNLEVHALGGQTLNPNPNNRASFVWQMHTDFLREYIRDTSGNHLLLPSNNLAYRREVFEAIGGFNPSFPLASGEDYEIAYRLVSQGYRQQFFPKATVWHDHPSTRLALLRRHFRYGQGAGRFDEIAKQKNLSPVCETH